MKNDYPASVPTNVGDKIKILFVLNTCRNCGPVQVVFNIIKKLDKSKFNAVIITLAKEPNDSKLNEILPYISEHVFCETKKAEILFGRMDKLRKTIIHFSPDVIHSTGVFPDYAISRLSCKNQIVTMHNYAPFDYINEFGMVKGQILVRMQYCAARRARRTVSCSKSLSELYSKNGLYFDYIRNGIDIDEYRPCSRAERVAMRKKLGYNNAFVFVYVGKFITRKNIDFMLDGFMTLYGNNPKISFFLLGDGPELTKMKRKYASVKNIFFLNDKKNVRDYLVAGDTFVSTSKSEGLPNAVLEAMACGLPVVLSDIPQHKEIVAGDAEKGGGLLFELGNKSDFRNKLAYAYKNAATLRNNTRTNIVSNFNSISMSSRYQEIYEEFSKRNNKRDIGVVGKVKYSIIVPAYNVEKYIGRCLDSLVKQGFDDMEIIVIDDGSTDSTLKIIKDYCERYKMVNVYHQSNKGLAAARKAGIDRACGEYCLTVDADDWLGENAMNIIDYHISHNKNVDVLKFRFIYEPFGKYSFKYDSCGHALCNDELNRLHRDLLLTDKYNNLCNQVFKKKLYIDAYNKKFEKISYGEDIVVNLGLIGKARTVILINDALYHYYENVDSITHKVNLATILNNLADGILVYKERLEYLRENNNSGISVQMLKNTLLRFVCERLKQYIMLGGKINDEFREEIKKSDIFMELEGVDLRHLSIIDRTISKSFLTMQHDKISFVKPYLLLRKKIRKIYHACLRVKRNWREIYG